MKVVETVPSALAGERVDRVVAMITGCSRAQVAGLVADGQVVVDGAVATNRSLKVAEGAVVEVTYTSAEERPGIEADPSIVVPVVYEDDHLIIVDKPAGLVVHPGAGNQLGTLVHGLLARYPEIADVGPDPDRPGVVHRLDKGTSGLLMVARTEEAYEELVDLLAARDIHRHYRTLVWGHVASPRGLIDAPIGRSVREPTRMSIDVRGKEARTRYEVRRRYDEPVAVTELACALETGRTHQIRVHLRSIGHAVVGDVRYDGARQSLPFGRPFLHAERLELEHPITDEPMTFESPLPADLQDLLVTLS